MTVSKSNLTNTTKSRRAPRAEQELTGIVLRAYPYGDSNLILKVLTQSRGKVSLAAKFARSSKKRFQGGFDIFDTGSFRVRIGGGEILGEVTEYIPEKNFASLRESLLRIVVGSFLTECFEMIIAEDSSEDPHAFNTLLLALEAVSHSNQVKEALKAAFLALGSLLAHEGILPTDALVPTFKNLKYLCQIIENQTHRKIASKEEVFKLLIPEVQVGESSIS